MILFSSSRLSRLTFFPFFSYFFNYSFSLSRFSFFLLLSSFFKYSFYYHLSYHAFLFSFVVLYFHILLSFIIELNKHCFLYLFSYIRNCSILLSSRFLRFAFFLLLSISFNILFFLP